jgi:methyl-accepting chemotaxis protein
MATIKSKIIINVIILLFTIIGIVGLNYFDLRKLRDMQDEGVHEVAKGSEKAADSGRALEQILDQINNVTTQIHQVATAAEEQTATTSEISNNMHQITDVVQQTASGAQESAAAAHQLAELAENLRGIVRQFKL